MQDYMGHKNPRRIGSAGRLVSCRFASEREAALAMAEHLEAKLRKGYDAV